MTLAEARALLPGWTVICYRLPPEAWLAPEYLPEDAPDEAMTWWQARAEKPVAPRWNRVESTGGRTRKEAIANKAFALFDIGINTLVAVTQLLARPIAAIAAGIAGAAMAAAVAAKPLPELATGGIAMPRPGGMIANVAEAGQPEVIFPLDRLEEFLSRRPAGGGADEEGRDGDIHLRVEIAAKPILDAIFPATRNRTVLIHAGAVVSG